MKPSKTRSRQTPRSTAAGSSRQNENVRERRVNNANNNNVGILVVEDSPTQSEYLKNILEKRGFHVSVARNGKQGLESVRKQKPTIVISDIVMPEMDGYELCRQIKSDDELRAVPVILLTSLSDPADIIRGLLCAADNFIVKPFDEKYLLSRIEYILVNRKLREQTSTQLGVEIYFAGKRHSITSDRLQILDLLFSTYETAVQKNIELAAVSKELKKLNEELERRVRERTAALLTEAERHKRTAEQLQKLSKAVEQTPDTVIITDGNGLIEYVNPSFEKLTGYGLEEVKGKTPRILKSGKHDRMFYEKLWHRILAGETVRNIFINRKKDGELYYNEQTISPLLDERGNITHFVSSGSDVTKEVQADEVLKESERRYRMLFADSPLPMWVFDLETFQFLAVNDAAVRLYGYSLEEFLSMTIKDIRPPEDLPLLLEDIAKARKGEATIGIWRHRKKDGTIIDVEVTANDLVFDERRARLVLANDVTERRRAQKVLQEAEERYRLFFEDDLTGDYTTTFDGRILDCNPAFLRIFGFSSKEEALATNVVTLYRNPETRRQMISRLLKEGKIEYYEVELVRRDGKPIYVVSNLIGKFDHEQHLVEIRGYLFDDTKRRQLEQQLQQSQRLESIGTLAGGIAHDFNNILGIIMGHATLLEKVKADATKLSKSTEAIAKASQRGASLVKQLLTFARKTEAVLESVHLNDIIKEFVGVLRETFPKSLEIITRLGDQIPPVIVDSTQFHQVFLNLCVNARDAMPSGGTLTVVSSRISRGALRLKFSNALAHEYVAISVADTGTGMDDKTRHRIFEPFFTTKSVGKGTGLGLAVVYGIMQSLDGFIDVESIQGKGTTFHLFFPIHQPDEVNLREQEQWVDEAPGGTETILVVEDEEMLRDLVSVLLEGKGYKVLEAEDGLKAIDTYKSHRNSIALVLSDMGLPKIGGTELFVKLQEIDPGVKVIFATGYVDPVQKSELLKSGASDVIHKPYVPEELLHRIREVIDQKSSR